MNKVYSVLELNRAVNELLAQDPVLGRIRVRGEISGLKKYPSGHSYFTLKDEDAAVSCVLFRQAARNAPETMRDGMQVVLMAQPNLYDKTGRFQLIVDAAEEEGLGDLYQRFLKLKETLEKEGLFDPANKKKIPYIPKRIVAITSGAGAVIRDIIHVLQRRFPGISLLLIPVPVQGAGAEREIAAAIELANFLKLGDVLIVGRGGGSLLDLQPFNEELTARAIAASDIPVISAVGHETDFTLSDFAADLRAPTPSAAAELSVPVKAELLFRIEQLTSSMEQQMYKAIEHAGHRLRPLAGRPVLSRPEAIVERQLARRELLNHRLSSIWEKLWAHEENKLQSAVQRAEQTMRIQLERQTARRDKSHETLLALSPLSVLNRGYSLVRDKEGVPVISAKKLKQGQAVDIVWHDGKADATITKTYPGKE